MKFICDRQAISNAVNTVLKAVSVHSTMPILEGIFIKAEPGKVTLTGNDLEIGINCVIEAEVVSTGSVVVNSKLFGEIIRKVSGDSVSIDVSNTNLTTIKCGNSKFNINGIDPSEYPELQYFNPDFSVTLTQKQLKDLIRHTIFAVGTNEAKLILTGCLLEAGGKEITMVAVDGFRLALKKTVSENDVIEGTTEEKVSVVIPSKTLNELTKIIEETDDDVKIICSEKNVRFEFNNVNLVSRLLEGDYIDYKKIIPSEFKTSVKTDVRSILNAVERVSLIITSEVNKAPIVMSIKTGEIEMNCETQAGNVEEIIPVETKGEGFEIGFNNKYLLDALRAATSENIVIDLIGSVNPCLITPEEGDDFKFIVLPVRI